MMTRVRNAGTNAIIADYLYDPGLRQRQKNVGGVKTNFYYAGFQRLADYDGTALTLQNRYVYGAGMDEILIQITSGGIKTFYHANNQGSVIATTNSSGAVLNRFKYSPYGESPSMTGTTHGYTGQRYDAETGLYYYKMRYYSPKIGRFLQPDPIGMAGGMNLYGYVGNSPLNSVDSSGLLQGLTYDTNTIVTLEKWVIKGVPAYHSSLLVDTYTYIDGVKFTNSTRIELFPAPGATTWQEFSGQAGLQVHIYSAEESLRYHDTLAPAFTVQIASGSYHAIYEQGEGTRHEWSTGDSLTVGSVIVYAEELKATLEKFDYRYTLPIGLYPSGFLPGTPNLGGGFLGLNSNQFIYEILRRSGFLSRVPAFWGGNLPGWGVPVNEPIGVAGAATNDSGSSSK